MSNQSISIAIQGIDRFSAPARKVAASSEKMVEVLSKGMQQTRKLAGQKALIDKYKKLESQLGKTAQRLDVARKQTKQLALEIAQTDKPSKKLLDDFKAAQQTAATLSRQHKQQRAQLRELKNALKEAGIEGRNFAQVQAEIEQKMAAANKQMQKAAMLDAKLAEAQKRYEKRYEKRLEVAGNLALVGHGALTVGHSITQSLASPIEQMRQVERSKGELKSLGIQDTQVVVRAGEQMSRAYAGVNTADFVRAAYDIKSGISTLDDAGVAAMTTAAAITAKATKGDVTQMTSLFATAYGSFKKQLYHDISDKQFGELLSAQLAASVQAFKTDGAQMQQAIESMGSGLAASGVSLAEQLTGLGMLQQKMSAGEAGTTLKALERSAAVAQQRFEKMGYAIRTLDDEGNLRALPDLLADVRKVFGDKYTTETGAKLLEAFGSDEAVKFFKALWGQEEAFRAQARALEQAGQQGMAFTEKMAYLMDANMDARLTVLSQKWDVLLQKIGYAVVPALEMLVNLISPAVDWIANLAERFPTLTTGVVGAVAGLAALATVVGTVTLGISALSAALARLSLSINKAKLSTQMQALSGADDAVGKKHVRWPWAKKVGLGGAALATGGLMLYDTWHDKQLSTSEKIQDTTQTIGGMGGSLAGAAAGAAIGSVIPVVGTAIGGIVGAIAGGWAGNELGQVVGGFIAELGEDKPSPIKKQVDTQLAQTPSVQSTTTQTKVINHHPTFNITQQPGEDTDALAQRINQINHEHLMRLELDVP